MKLGAAMARLAYRMELALRVLWSGDYWTAHVNELLREREASEYRIARVGYEATIARIDLANMNRWRERALSAERKVEQFQKIVRQRGPRPLRLP